MWTYEVTPIKYAKTWNQKEQKHQYIPVFLVRMILVNHQPITGLPKTYRITKATKRVKLKDKSFREEIVYTLSYKEIVSFPWWMNKPPEETDKWIKDKNLTLTELMQFLNVRVDAANAFADMEYASQELLEAA